MSHLSHRHTRRAPAGKAAGPRVLFCSDCETVSWDCTRCDGTHEMATKRIEGPNLVLVAKDGATLTIPLTTVKGDLTRLLS